MLDACQVDDSVLFEPASSAPDRAY